MPGHRILSTHAYSLSPAWLERVDALDRRSTSAGRRVLRVVRSASSYDAVVLDGSVGWSSGYGDLVAAAIVSRRRNGPAVVVTDCSWKLGNRRFDRFLCRLGVRLLDSRRVTYCVRSTEEVDVLPATWGLDPSRVALTPYGHTVTVEEMALPEPDRSGIFAGGNALRDYGTLLEAVRGLPMELTIVTSLQVQGGGRSNLNVVPVKPHSRFIDLMRSAHIVVVPFRAGIRRASGMDTYLSAMALGQVVIVTECPGASDYIEHGRTGILVPAGDAGALRGAIEWCYDPSNQVELQEMRDRARQVARERFSFARHAELLLDVVDNAIRANGGRRVPREVSSPETL